MSLPYDAVEPLSVPDTHSGCVAAYSSSVPHTTHYPSLCQYRTAYITSPISPQAAYVSTGQRIASGRITVQAPTLSFLISSSNSLTFAPPAPGAPAFLPATAAETSICNFSTAACMASANGMMMWGGTIG
eukprot:77126-Rhodomonas_salina.2